MMQRTTDSRSQNSNKQPAISFRHLCHLERPTSWPVSQLYGEIMSSGSALQALYNAPVTDITVCQCYTRQGNTMHQYIILCICSPDPNMLSGLGRVWARCERNAGAEPHSGTARDTITFSIERPKLRANGDKALMECTYDSLKVEHIADLLKIVHDIAPRYEKTSHNEWWFVAIAVGALQSLRTDWTIKPPKEWSSKAVEVLSKANTRARSQEIARLFDSHWHPSSVAPVPVYSYQAWGVAAERPLPVVPAKAPTPAVEPEPTIEEPPEQQTLSVSSDTPSTSPSPSWSSTNLAFGDAISSVRRIFEESHYLDMAKTYSEPDLVMDLLQDALDDPSERLGTLRTPALRLLQDISWASDQLPRRVKLPPVRNRVFWDSGGEAVIWTGQLSGKKVIVRDARPPDGKDWTSPGGKLVLKLVRRQVVAHLQIHHPNVLPLLGTTTDTGHPLSVITPFAENGHALRYLNNMDRGERPATFLRISANIASALYYLHTREPPIIHGDVHARNIVIDESGTPLLCDFGLSRIQHEQTRTFTSIIEGGKYRYLAPELFSYSPDDATFPKFRTTSATDCYAFAMAMLEMATLKRPFVEFENEMSASRAAERGIRPRRCGEDMMGDLSSDAVDLVWALLGRMWAHDPKARPGLDAVEARLEEISASIGAGNLDQ